MVQRNLLVYKHTWMVIFSGFFEPVFYLFGIGIGLGRMVPALDGVSYTAFVAPGLLASSCLNGAITDGSSTSSSSCTIRKPTTASWRPRCACRHRVRRNAVGALPWLDLRRRISCRGRARRSDRAADAALAMGAAGWPARCSLRRRFRPWRYASRALPERFRTSTW